MYNKRLEICLKCNNSKFGSQNLQLNGTATGAPNSCSYVDLAVFNIDKNVLQAKRNTYQEILGIQEGVALRLRRICSTDEE